MADPVVTPSGSDARPSSRALRLTCLALLAVGFALGCRTGLTAAPAETSGELLDTSFLFVPVLVNNLSAGALLVLGGWTLGILTVLGILWSGFVWGLFFGACQRSAGTAVALALGLPHGLVEIAWIALLGALGLETAHGLWTSLRTGSLTPVFAPLRRLSFWRTVTASAALIVLGALVEAFLTARIAHHAVGL